MARIAGVNIPTNKRVTISLRYIYGVGPTKAQEICDKLGIADDRRVNQLSDDEVLKIREMIDREYRVEGDLRKLVPRPPTALVGGLAQGDAVEPGAQGGLAVESRD